MASVSSDPNGRRRVIFKGADEKRHTIRLGKMPKKDAETVAARVQAIASAQRYGRRLDAETADWIADQTDMIHAKLAAVGLVTPRQQQSTSAPDPSTVLLSAFVGEYITGRTDVKPNTTSNLKQAEHYLVDYFGEKKLLADITPGDADEYRRHLMAKLAENTARRHCGRAKQFFRAAVRKRLLLENPFADMKGCNVKANPERLYYVTRDEAEKVLEKCPDAEWRLIFALARFGGLRTPQRTSRVTLERREFPSPAHDGSQPQDGAPRRQRVSSRPDLPRIASLPGRCP